VFIPRSSPNPEDPYPIEPDPDPEPEADPDAEADIEPEAGVARRPSANEGSKGDMAKFVKTGSISLNPDPKFRLLKWLIPG
jgi:hypothetical protein